MIILGFTGAGVEYTKYIIQATFYEEIMKNLNKLEVADLQLVPWIYSIAISILS